MAIYTVRVQTVLSSEQFDLLNQLSEETRKSLSQLVREAIQQVYVEKDERLRRRQALQKLLELEAPVADWDQMEKEIIAGSIE